MAFSILTFIQLSVSLTTGTGFYDEKLLLVRTRQSSVGFHGHADLAIDGNKDSEFSHGSCSSTFDGDILPFWEAKFEELSVVNEVKIMNRNIYGERLANITIYIRDAITDFVTCEWITEECTNQICNTFEGPGENGKEYTIRCLKPRIGRFVTIKQFYRILTLCEVEVFGLPLRSTEFANLALNRFASQSSIMGEKIADLATDGNLSSSNSCSQTDPTVLPHFWIVELQDMSWIYQVKILNRDTPGYWLASINITIGKKFTKKIDEVFDITSAEEIDGLEQCTFFEGPGIGGVFYTFSCMSPLNGTIVLIQKTTNDSPLSLCEVEVMGHYM